MSALELLLVVTLLAWIITILFQVCRTQELILDKLNKLIRIKREREEE